MSKITRLAEALASDQTSVAQSQQIQSAIDELSNSGGGIVVIGAGTWHITTIFLRSRITLHLEAGATLQAETDLRLYPRQGPEANNKDQTAYHLIIARDCEDIAITGAGIIDGQDTAFWAPAKTEAERPYGIFDFYVPGDRLSPLIQIVRCRNVRVEQITIRRSPGWTLHFFDCDEICVQGVRMRNHLLGPNTDGVTVNGCRNAVITGCDIITGDDALGVKATNAGIASRNISFSDCVLETNCSAVVLGAETEGGIYDVTVNNCVTTSSLRVITIELWDAGQVENATFTNMSGRTFPSPNVTCERPIYLDIQEWNRGGDRSVAGLGSIRNISISNFKCTTRGRIVMTAQDGSTIENVVLRDVHLDVPEIEDAQVAVPKARSMQNSNFNPKTRAARAAVVADNVSGLVLENVSVNWPRNTDVSMHAMCLRHVEDAKIDSPSLRSNSDDRRAARVDVM